MESASRVSNLIDDGTYKYSYNSLNCLTVVRNQSNQNIAQYRYDYLNRRVIKTIFGSPDVTTKYCYDGGQVIAEYEGGNLVRKFIYGPGIDEPIMMIAVDGGETKYYYHFDGLGSVAALSNNSGDIVERYSYDVFGDPNRVSNVGNPYLFTGRRYDSEAELYYYRARYYKPSIGRFLQTDPIGYIAGLNLYTYVKNNPTNWTDPSGKGPWKWIYTGDWNASDETYDAAVESAGEFLYKSSPVRGFRAGVGYNRVAGGVSWSMDRGFGVDVGGSLMQIEGVDIGLGSEFTQEGGLEIAPGGVIGSDGVWAGTSQGEFDFGIRYGPGYFSLATDPSRLDDLVNAWKEILGIGKEKDS